MNHLLRATLLAVALTGCATFQETETAAAPPAAMPPMDHGAMSHNEVGAGLDTTNLIQTPIIGANGAGIGVAYIGEGPAGVLIRMQFDAGAIPPGWHGAHLHQVGDCSDAAAGFQASGAHVGKRDGVQHGLRNPQGPEAGDLPNLFAPSRAEAFGYETFSAFTSLAGTGGRAALLDTDGSAIIIHAASDDHMSQPIGGAGARIACAALPGTGRAGR